MTHRQLHPSDMNMTEGALLKKLLAVALPLALSGILQLLFNAADLVVVGNFSETSTLSLAAVSSNTALINLMVNVSIGLSIGANVVISQALGRKNADKAHRAVHSAVLLALVCGLITTAVGCSLARVFLQWMQTDAAVLDKATLYLRIYFAGAPANILYNFGVSILRAKGDTRRPLAYLALAGVLNVGLNMIFVIFAKMDVAGVALATILSQYLSCALTIAALIREKGYCRLQLRAVRFYKAELKQILRVGLPSGILSSFFSVANVLIQSNINSFGYQLVAGSSTGNTFEGFVYVTMNAVSNAAVSFVGQNYGARNFARIRRVVRICLLVELFVSLFWSALFLPFGRFFVGLYTKDEMVITYACNRLRVTLPIYFVCGMVEVFVAGMRGMGYSITPTVANFFCICVYRIIWVATICQVYRYPELLYASWPISWLLNILVDGILYARVYRRESTKQYPIEPPDIPTAADVAIP